MQKGCVPAIGTQPFLLYKVESAFFALQLLHAQVVA